MTATLTQHSTHPVLPCPLTRTSRRELYTLHSHTYTSGRDSDVESSIIRLNPCPGNPRGLFPYTVHNLLFASDIPRRCCLSSTYPASVYWQRDTHMSRLFFPFLDGICRANPRVGMLGVMSSAFSSVTICGRTSHMHSYSVGIRRKHLNPCGRNRDLFILDRRSRRLNKFKLSIVAFSLPHGAVQFLSPQSGS